MRALSFRVLVVGLLLLAVGPLVTACGEVPATNPFDPATPADQQGTARLELTLTLPAAFDAATFAEAPTAVLTDLQDADAGRTTPLTVGESGDTLRLQMGEVRPGDYRLVFSLRPLAHEPLLVHVPIGGGTLVLPALALSAPAATLEESGLLVGRARRTDGGETGHGGIDVRAVGTPYTTRTAEDGAYSLLVPPGVYSVAAATEFHGTEVAPEVRATAGETKTVPDLVLDTLPGTVTVDVALQAGVDVSLLEEFRVTLRPAAEPDAMPVAVGALADARVTEGRARGRFVLTEIPAGTWEVRVGLEGYQGDAAVVDVLPGRATTAPLLEVRLEGVEPGEAPPTRIAGRARLAGVVGERGHGGSRVEVEGTPLVGFTADDGGFELTVPARRTVLQVHRPGYASASVTVASVPQGALTQLPEELVLSPLPGRVRGVVVFGRYGGADRLPEVSVRLLDAAGQPAASTVPGPDGGFVLPVPPGEFMLEAATRGFAPARQPVGVVPGGESAAGSLLLRHLSETDAAVPLRGVVTALGAPSQAGTTVRVRFAGRDTPFQTIGTDAEGRFEIPAAPDEDYLLTFEREGWAPGAAVGPVRWDAADARFERTDLDAALLFELTPSPFAGRIAAEYRVQPAWVPEGQVRATVAFVGPAGTRIIDGVAPGQRVIADVDAQGVYLVRISGPGFLPAEGLVNLDNAAPEQGIEDVLVLNDLAEAALDLGAATLTSDQLVGIRLDGANLAGVTLVGDFEGVPLRGVNLVNADLRGATLAGVSLARADLRGADLTGVDATAASFEGADLFGARLAGAVLVGAHMEGADLSSAVLDGATFTGEDEPLPAVPCDLDLPRPAVRLDGAHLTGASLTGARLSGVDLRRTDLTNARLTDARLDRTCLRGGVLTLTDLTGATLEQADLGGASVVLSVLQNARLRGADLRGARLISSVLEGADLGCVERGGDGTCTCVETFEDADDGGLCASPDTAEAPRCRCRTRLGDANLNGASLAGADLSGADLVRVFGVQVATGDAAGVPSVRPTDCALPPGCAFDPAQPPACMLAAGRACLLRRTRFVGARLDAAELPGLLFAHADLTGASLRGANLTLAQFTPSTTFRFADFGDAVLTGARLSATDLRGARFDGASLGSAALDTADARGTSFRRAIFEHSDVSGARLAGADLREIRLRDTDLTTTADADGRPLDLTGADLEGELIGWLGTRSQERPAFSAVRLDQANLRGVSLGVDLHADFAGRSFRDADLTGADLGQIGTAIPGDDSGFDFSLEQVDLTGATLDAARLPPAASLSIFDEVTVAGARSGEGGAWLLVRSRLRDADLTARRFPALRWVQTDARGVHLGRVTGPDQAVEDPRNPGSLEVRLSRLDDLTVDAGAVESLDARLCDLRGLPWPALFEGGLPGALNLVSSDLRGVDLRGLAFAPPGDVPVTFTDVDLRGARFDDARLGIPFDLAGGVQFVRADLGGARFNGATLDGVFFMATDLLGVDFTQARLDRPLFENSDLADAGAQVGIQITNPQVFRPNAFIGQDLTQGDAAPCAFAALAGTSSGNFARADLRCRSLEADIVETNFADARLDGARLAVAGGLSQVGLARARLNGATLPRTITGGTLREADLTGALGPGVTVQITGVDLTGTRLETAAGNALTLREVDVSTNAATALLRHTVGPGSVLFGARAPDMVAVGALNRILASVAADDADFSRAQLRPMQFKSSSLARVSLRDGVLPTSLFSRVVMDEADLRGAALGGSVFHRAMVRCTHFDGADLRDAALMGLITDGCLSAVGAELEGARFRGAITYVNPVTNEATTHEVREIHADLRGVDLSSARLAGVDLAGADLRGTTLVEAVLSDADLTDAVLVDAELNGADLSGATLGAAQLTGANLSGADLTEATLIGALAAGADLSGANLGGADLTGAWFWAADLSGADLRHARFQGASFSGAALAGARVCLSARAALPPGGRGAPLYDPGC